MRFHCLATSDWSPPTAEEQAAGWRWTYAVDVALAGRDSRVALSMLAPRENHAGVLRLEEALSPPWADHVHRAGAEWLLPWLSELRGVSGWRSRRVHRRVLAAFAERHGRPPTSYTWDV